MTRTQQAKSFSTILLLALALLLAFSSTFPPGAFAAEADDAVANTADSADLNSLALETSLQAPGPPVPDGTPVWDGAVDVRWYQENPDASEYHLTSPQQLAGVAAIVNGIVNPGAVIYRDSSKPDPIVDNQGSRPGDSFTVTHWGADDFSGKTIYLDNDMDLGGVFNSTLPLEQAWSGPNFMPIGGAYCMDLVSSGFSQIVQTQINASFNGMIDGQGHMLFNMYCKRYSGIAGWTHVEATGLIGRLGAQNPNLPQPNNLQAAGVRRLGISGYNSGMRMVGSFVGAIGKPTNGTVIEQCVNYATNTATDAFGVGGIVGSARSSVKGVIRNCYNAGYIYRTHGWQAAGIAGLCGIEMSNCYNIGPIQADGGETAALTFAENVSGMLPPSLHNNYWLKDSAQSGSLYTLPGYEGGIGTHYGGTPVVTACSQLSSAEMLDADFLNLLNDDGADNAAVFVNDDLNLNNGYPVLWWQRPGSSLNYEVSVTAAQHGSVNTDAVTPNAVTYGTTITINATPDPAVGSEPPYYLIEYLVNGLPQQSNKVFIDGKKVISARFGQAQSLGQYHFAYIPTQVYSGQAITPALTVFNQKEDAILAQGTDYTVSWANNTAAGFATATATGIGKYSGTIQISFNITDKTSLNQAIADAINAWRGVYQSLDGTDVEAGCYWVTAEEKTAFDYSLSRAQSVAGNAESQQLDIDDAVDYLSTAEQVFLAAAHSRLGSAPILNDRTPLQAAIAAAGSENGGAQYGIAVRPNGSDVARDKQWVNQNDKNALDIARSIAQGVYTNPFPLAKYQIAEATDALNKAIATYNAAKKYGNKASADDFSSLGLGLQSAESAKFDVAVSANGSELVHTRTWVSKAALDAFDAAIAAAQQVLNNSGASETQVVLALNDLQAAVDSFNAAKKLGTIPTRLYGPGRYDTMQQIVLAAFKQSDYVIVARGDNYPDALAASGLAGLLDAPVVISASNTLSSQAEVTIKSLQPKYIYLLGDNNSLSAAVEKKLKTMVANPANVQRIAGNSRNQTALKIYEQGKLVGAWKDTAIITNGSGYADALSISPYAYAQGAPIFLSSVDGGLDSAVLKAIGSGGFSRILLLGDKNAVPTKVETQLKQLGGGFNPTLQRIQGRNRYETSSMIVNFVIGDSTKTDYDNLAIARGDNFPDALVGAAFAARNNTTLLLVGNTNPLDGSFGVENVIAANSYKISHVHIFGSTDSVSAAMSNKIHDAYK